MNEWLKKNTAKLREKWSSWKPVQKVILVAIIIVMIVAVVVMARTSSAPTGVPLFNIGIADEQMRQDICFRLEESNVKYSVSSDGKILVNDEATARRMRSLLTAENLVPAGIDPWDFLNVSQWSMTDIERNENRKQAITKAVQAQIESLADVANAEVVIGQPDDALFAEDQKPVTASVILRFKQGSDMQYNKAKIRTVQNLLIHSVVGLKEEYITIADAEGNELNNFAGQADVDRLTLVERTEKFKLQLANKIRAKVLKQLQDVATEDRVRNLNVNVDMDTSKASSDKTIYTPITITPQDPDKPYDTRVTKDSFVISSQTVTKEWTGTGYNPQGPAGVDGQNPPVYSDMSNMIGKSTETGVTQNTVVNSEHRIEERMPAVDRITVSVNIDGTWRTPRDPKTHQYIIDDDENSIRYGGVKREYTPVPAEELENYAKLIQGAVGYDASRNYLVEVTNIQIDRTAQFDKDDEAYFAAINRKRTIVIVLVGVIAILLAFIIFRMVSREIERRKRLREEEILRRQQAEREKALWDAKQEGVEVTMSVEERKRAELQENAIAMAKEHPEDVAMLIRTWLMEDN